MNRGKNCSADGPTPTCGAAEEKKNEREKNDRDQQHNNNLIKGVLDR